MLVALARPPERSIGSWPIPRMNQPMKPALERLALEQLLLGREGQPALDHRGQDERVARGDVVADQHSGAGRGDVLLTLHPGAEQQPDERPDHQQPQEPVEQRQTSCCPHLSVGALHRANSRPRAPRSPEPDHRRARSAREPWARRRAVRLACGGDDLAGSVAAPALHGSLRSRIDPVLNRWILRHRSRRRSAARRCCPVAEPYEGGDGPLGVLVLHGFTGDPSSMRPWAEQLERDGFRVSCRGCPVTGRAGRR